MLPSNPFVIAEFGSSHDGVFDHFLDGIKVAARCGANAFKTQWMSSPERVAQRMSAPDAIETHRKYQWPAEWLPLISKAAHDAGLEFLCTVDLPEDIAVVAAHVDRFKIASWGALDHYFIACHEAIAPRKPIILSTGLCSEGDMGRVHIRRDMGHEHDGLLHCVSGYPTPLEECNLAAIGERGLDGFSDHTANPLTGALAVAAGARILEVHFRLDDTDPENPDYVVSLNPGALKSYIWLARRAADAMGDGVKRVMPSEEKNVRHRYV